MHTHNFFICFKRSPPMRSQIRRLYVPICIGGYRWRETLKEDCPEMSFVAYMCRFVLKAIDVQKVLRGLSRDCLCRLYVSICIGGYSRREVLRGQPRDFLCRLYLSICIGGYSRREVLRGLSRDFLCRLYVSICIGGYSRGKVLRGLSRDFFCRLYLSICIGGYSRREVLRRLSRDFFCRQYVSICFGDPGRIIARFPLSPICVLNLCRLTSVA